MTAEMTGQATKRRLVLVVDDDASLCELIARVLKKSGYAVLTAATGREAIDRVKSNRSVVLLLDQLLPDGSGSEVIRELSAAGISIPFLVMTGQGDERLAVEMMKLGAADYLVKDADLIGLLPEVMDRVFRHVETERRLGEVEAALSAFVLNSSDMVAVKDLNRRIIATNMAYARATGRKSIEEIIGKTDAEVLGMPEESPRMRRFEQEDLKAMKLPPGELLVHEEPFTFANGQEHTVLTRRFPVYGKDGCVSSIGMICIDITQRKKAEEALRESEEKLGILFASMTEMVVLHELVFDAQHHPVDYRILDCNSAFTEITGISRLEAVGQLASLVYGTSHAPFLDEYAGVVCTGEPSHFDCWFAPMQKHFSVSAVSLGNNRFSTISTDITAIKHVQEIISTKNRDLERIVYVASHDLREPLVSVDGCGQELELSLDEIRQTLEQKGSAAAETEQVLQSKLARMAGALGEIRSSTRQMERLVDSLLELSRLGHVELDIRPVDMNRLLPEVLAAMENRAQEVGAELRFDDLPPCRADATLLRQVFENLIDNALKYLDLSRPGVITVSGMVDRGQCVFCVEDNGVGIDAANHETVFDLFERSGASEPEGEGLGLPVVRQILGRLNGRIRLESKPGVGSRFYVMLPAG